MTELAFVPKLRFRKSEKHGPIKRIAFDDLFIFSSGKNIKQNEAAPHFKTPCVRYGELYHMYSEVITEVQNRTNLERSELKISEGNEILLPSAGEDPLDIASASALVLKGVAIGRTINVLKPKRTKEYDHRFASYYINNVLSRNISQLARGASISNVYNSDLKRLQISLPSITEQVEIANFLMSLDRLIGLHQQKHSKLVTLKQVMLQRMFPQNGTATPAIRFKGFSEPWVKKPLGDLFPITSAARVHKNEWTNSGVPFFRSSDVVSVFKGKTNTKAFISFKLYEELSAKVGKIKKGDILITGGGSIGVPYLVHSDEPLYFKDADLLWFKIRESVDSHFLYTFFSSDPFRRHVKSISHIGTIAHYTVEQAKETPLLLPCKPAEQQKIGSYFRQLDTLITKHTTQLEKLKQLKSACLEKMFV